MDVDVHVYVDVAVADTVVDVDVHVVVAVAVADTVDVVVVVDVAVDMVVNVHDVVVCVMNALLFNMSFLVDSSHRPLWMSRGVQFFIKKIQKIPRNYLPRVRRVTKTSVRYRKISNSQKQPVVQARSNKREIEHRLIVTWR